jgi:hypothetical protein
MIIIKNQSEDSIVYCTDIKYNSIQGGLYANNESYHLGHYSHKRALDIMSEIENHINDCLNEKQYTNEHRASNFNWIYTMPKE